MLGIVLEMLPEVSREIIGGGRADEGSRVRDRLQGGALLIDAERGGLLGMRPQDVGRAGLEDFERYSSPIRVERSETRVPYFHGSHVPSDREGVLPGLSESTSSIWKPRETSP